MKLSSMQSLLALFVSICLVIGSAASAGIGIVQSKGAFRLDQSTVLNNGTLLEGTVIETAALGSSVVLNSGTRFALGADSRGRVFGDRLILEKGSSSLETSTAFKVMAAGLTIQPERSSSSGRVEFRGSGRIHVQSSAGALRVLSSNGRLIANMQAGTALAFEPQAEPSSVTRVTGCLAQKSGHLVMTDEVTSVAVEITGDGVAQEVGNRIEVTGSLDSTSTPSTAASQIIRSRSIRRISKGCAPNTAAAATGAAGGMAIGHGAITTTVAVIGGVAVAGVVGGLAAAEALPGQGSRASSR